MIIPVKSYGYISEKLSICADYSPKNANTVKTLLDDIIINLCAINYPGPNLKVTQIDIDSFTEWLYEERHRTLNDHLCDMERCYARWNIREYDDLSRGLHIYVSSLIYQHGIHNRKITCLYMKKLQTTEPTKCKIYNMMIRNKGLTQKNLSMNINKNQYVNMVINVQYLCD